jgi:hypothetical protein
LARWLELLPRFWKVVPHPPIQLAPVEVEEEEAEEEVAV